MGNVRRYQMVRGGEHGSERGLCPDSNSWLLRRSLLPENPKTFSIPEIRERLK
jgi:hypothetical protein